MCLFCALLSLALCVISRRGNLADLPVYDFIAMVHKKRFA